MKIQRNMLGAVFCIGVLSQLFAMDRSGFERNVEAEIAQLISDFDIARKEMIHLIGQLEKTVNIYPAVQEDNDAREIDEIVRRYIEINKAKLCVINKLIARQEGIEEKRIVLEKILGFLYKTIDRFKATYEAQCALRADRINIAIIVESMCDFGMWQNFRSLVDKYPSSSDEHMRHHTYFIMAPPYIALCDRNNLSNFKIYVSLPEVSGRVKHLHDFALLIPKSETRSLENLGFNEAFWSTQLSERQLEEFEGIYHNTQEFDDSGKPVSLITIDSAWLERIKNLFRTDACSHNKFIMLTGHGLPNTRAAGMPMNIFKNYLQFLTNIRTSFLWVNTCFSGGFNVTHYQEILKKNIKQRMVGFIRDENQPQFIAEVINYPVVFDSSTDLEAVTIESLITPYLLFGALAKLEVPTIYQARDLSMLMNEVFPNAESLPLSNLPILYIPGADFFRAVELKDSTIITNVMLRQLRMTHYLRTANRLDGTSRLIGMSHLAELRRKIIENDLQSGHAEVSTEGPTITIDQSRKVLRSVQLYPQDLHDVSIRIDKGNMPGFISKIPGCSNHVLKCIQAPRLTLAQIVDGLFPNFAEGRGARLTYPKVWFIEKVSCFDENLRSQVSYNGVLIYKAAPFRAAIFTGADLDDDNQAFQFGFICVFYKTVHGTCRGELILSDYNNPLKRPTIKEQWPINQVQYENFMLYIYSMTRAKKDALYESSGGLETIESQDRAFLNFARNVIPGYTKNLESILIDAQTKMTTDKQFNDEFSNFRNQYRLRL